MQLGFCALILVLFSTVLSADIGFVAAYLIDDAGQRQEVEIRRRGWAYNPVQITYRLPGETKSRIAGIADVQEFGFGVGGERFVRHRVAIDMSSADPAWMSRSPVPEFRDTTIFLRQCVDGAADLFYWATRHVERFFLRLGDDPPTQLIARSYRDGASRVRTAHTFRRQLAGSLRCGARPLAGLGTVNYELADLSATVVRSLTASYRL